MTKISDRSSQSGKSSIRNWWDYAESWALLLSRKKAMIIDHKKIRDTQQITACKTRNNHAKRRHVLCHQLDRVLLWRTLNTYVKFQIESITFSMSAIYSLDHDAYHLSWKNTWSSKMQNITLLTRTTRIANIVIIFIVTSDNCCRHDQRHDAVQHTQKTEKTL